MPNTIDRETADRIVAALVEDFTDRRGLRQAWESIDRDIRRVILDEWTAIVERAGRPPARS